MRRPRIRQHVILIVVAVVVAAMVGSVGSPARADENESPASIPVVQSIEWRGNHAISESDLRAHVLTQSSRWPSFWITHPLREDDLKADMDRIAALYRLRGYFEAKAEYSLHFNTEDREGATEDAASTVAVTIRIHEGETVRTQSIRIRLPDDIDPTTHPLIEAAEWDQLVDSLPLLRGEVFELEHYRASGQILRSHFAELGFPQTRLVGGAEVDLERHLVTVNWTLELGPRVRLGEIEIRGLEAVDEFIVQREITFEPGQWYSLRAMAATRRRLQNLSLFRFTLVESEAPEGEPTGEDVWPVQIRLDEGSPRRVRLGGGWGTDTSFRAELSWHHRNYFGGARHADITARYSAQGTVLRPTFMEPYLFGTRTRLLVSPAVGYETRDAYSARRILVDVQLQRELARPWSIRLGYRVDRSDVFSVNDDPGDNDLPEGVAINTGPHLAIRRSTVANPLNARSGTSMELAAEASVSALGSDHSFIRYTFDLRSFHEIWSTVVAGRLLLGSIQNVSNTKSSDIPLVERFFSGGSSSMRGFGYRSLGPKDADGDSIGGSSLIEASVEWRFSIFRNLGAVAFVDAAFVGPEPFIWEIDSLRYAAGPGLRYDTPAGPIRVDFAWSLNPADRRGAYRINASLGHTF